MSPINFRSGNPAFALVAAMLLLRALVPAGWMPVQTGEGVRIELCAGGMPGETGEQARQATALLHAALAGSQQQRQDGDRPPPPDLPCSFAMLGAVPVPDAPAPAPPPATTPAEPTRLAYTVTLGRGLPAPPPPATGPPSIA